MDNLEDYEHHVFLSYARHRLIQPWVDGMVERLQFWLSQELGESALVFYDQDSIEIGDHFPDKIRRAIQGSRCLVTLWSSEYFQSRWCFSEWQSFVQRQKLPQSMEANLVAPIKIADGDSFPTAASQVQMADFSQYTSTIPTFWRTERADQFEQEQLKKFVRALAGIVRRAPPFQPGWPANLLIGSWVFPAFGDEHLSL